MNDERIDLSPLDPTRDARFEHMVGSIARDALTARTHAVGRGSDFVAGLASWLRPALLAAAIVLAVAIPALARLARGSVVPPRPVAATEIMGIPRELTDLLHAPNAPTILELHDALASADGR